MTATLEQEVETLGAPAPAFLAPINEPDAIRVLLIEDGVIERGFLTDELSKQGFAVQTVASLPGAADAARDADVIVLHCDRAKKSSIDLLIKLRGLCLDIPVVLLTDEATPAHECLAIDKGAVDVICKSRGSEVLATRLKGVVKTIGRTDQRVPGGPASAASWFCVPMSTGPIGRTPISTSPLANTTSSTCWLQTSAST